MDATNDNHCPFCGRFVALDGEDTYYMRANDQGLDGFVSAFCNQDHAERFEAKHPEKIN